ncbi:hypothetical protein MMYC01_203488 [Madurella mycetomatis]|uniref:Ribonucleases P/MRP subunit Pop8-like domain-containing protein n=1 Tax=Madurella mycetomatis TaxID=100816 RepID=A0A175W651_9PEZI|nr:hypothetical protein MMYC01_203488 [Madurella mycetomatis]
MSSNPHLESGSAMDIDDGDHSPPSPKRQPKPSKKSQILLQTTLRPPPFAYAHLSLAPTPPDQSHGVPPLDALQVRSYLTSALRQFLGHTGAGMSVDILLVRGGSAWVRVPQPDLGAFAAAVTAYPGTGSHGAETTMVLQLKACGDWLGALLGREEEAGLWTS